MTFDDVVIWLSSFTNPTILGLLLFLVLFGAILGVLELGRRLGEYLRATAETEEEPAGISMLNGAVFGLLGLLIAFTFSGAMERFDARRQLIVQEANDIGTAYLRLDLLPAEAIPQLREDFRSYVDSRLAFYRLLPDLKAARVEEARYTALQTKIWSEAVAASKQMPSPAVMTLVLSSLNDMIDITSTRSLALRTHPPAIIFMMLVLIVLASSALAGFGMAGTRKRAWLHMLGFALLTSFSIYVIVNLEFPRAGIARLDDVDQYLVEVRKSMR